jgi:DNA-binding transcriptional ArsR family regulator
MEHEDEDRMKILDYTAERRAEFAVEVTYHSVVDLLLSLWIMGHDACGDPIDDLDIGENYFDDLVERLDSTTRGRLDGLGSGEPWIALLSLVPTAGEGGTVDEFLSVFDSHDPVDLRARLVWLYQEFNETEAVLAAKAASGDREAVDALLDSKPFSATTKKPWREALRVLLEMEPTETRDFLGSIMRSVQDAGFKTYESEFRPFIESDFAAKKAMSHRLSPQRLVEIASNGISIEDRDADTPILLMPSMVARPWVVLSESPNVYIMAYPVSDRTLASDPDSPPAWLVKLHKALGDEKRLKILRRLAQADASLVELTAELDIPKSTLHHHMMLLRAAGLIRVHVGDDKRYSLRDETLPEAATYLNHYIHPSSDHEETTAS